MQYARQLGLDDTYIQMDETTGWKMSYYLEGCHSLDYHNDAEVDEALRMMRKLHDAHIHSAYDFDLWRKTEEFIEKIRHKGRTDFADFEKLYKKSSICMSRQKQTEWQNAFAIAIVTTRIS